MLPYSPRRVAKLIGAFSLLALASPVASAGALEPATSRITSPAVPVYTLSEEGKSSSPAAFTVEGTTNVSGEKLALRCYYGPGAAPPLFSTLAEVEPESGSFKAEVKPTSLSLGPCVLRAVPTADTADRRPGTAAEEALEPFKGPRLVGSSFQLVRSGGLNVSYQLLSSTLTGFFDIESVGACGLNESFLYAPETLAISRELFFCNAALYASDDPPAGPSTRSELQIDEANAYSPAAASRVNEAIEAELEHQKEPVVPVAGIPQVTVKSRSIRRPASRRSRRATQSSSARPRWPFRRRPPVARALSPPASSSNANWQTSDANQVASMTDNWSSTDGAAHALNALYDQETPTAAKAAPTSSRARMFSRRPKKGRPWPCRPGWAGSTTRRTPKRPRGRRRTPAGSDRLRHPAQRADLGVPRHRSKEGYNGFEMPYQGTIPAGGAYTLRMAFVQAYKLSEVEALSAEVLAGYPPSAPPALSITSPASGTTVSSPSVTVSGTATDKRVITSFTVDGKAVSVGANGAWSTSVTLNKGANTITALATDQAGFSTEKSVSVTYTPVSPPPVRTPRRWAPPRARTAR